MGLQNNGFRNAGTSGEQPLNLQTALDTDAPDYDRPCDVEELVGAGRPTFRTRVRVTSVAVDYGFGTVISRSLFFARRIASHDPSGPTARALRALGLEVGS